MTSRGPASLVESGLDIEPPDVIRALFYGLGADGTVGANKNTARLAASPERHAQAYFVYDSKKSGSYTISHLRFGPRPIQAPYLLESASFIGVHKFDFLFKLDVLASAAPGATVLINCPYPPDRVWTSSRGRSSSSILDRKLRLHAIQMPRRSLRRSGSPPGRTPSSRPASSPCPG